VYLNRLDNLYAGKSVIMYLSELDWIGSFKNSIGLIITLYNSHTNDLLVGQEINFDYEMLLTQDNILSRIKEGSINQALFISNSLNCIWILTPIHNQDCFENKYDFCIIGPTLIGTVSKDQIAKYYYSKGLNLELAMLIAKQYEKIPIISYSFFMHFYYYIFQFLNGRNVELGELGYFNRDELTSPQVNVNSEEFYQQDKQDFAFYISDENFLRDCVSNGNVEWVKNRKMSLQTVTTILGQDEIRSLKNTLIIGISIITRAAIKGGLPAEVAFPLSDVYIVRLESLKEITLIADVYQQALLDFTTKVKNNKFRLHYSHLINNTCEYILANVDNPIKVSDVAKKMGVHPDTLAKRFKSETNKAILDFIREAKIEEAKFLLSYSDKSLCEISNVLAFSSQSQFIISFKRVTGSTPSEYRIQNKI